MQEENTAMTIIERLGDMLNMDQDFLSGSAKPNESTMEVLKFSNSLCRGWYNEESTMHIKMLRDYVGRDVTVAELHGLNSRFENANT